MTSTRLLASTAALALVLGLAACTAEAEEPAAAPTDSQAPVPPATEPEPEQPEPEPETFSMPQDCTTILPSERVDALLEQGIALIGGPGTDIGATYLPEPTREEAVGGMSCFFEDEARPNIATFTISVAPISPSARAQVVTDLTAHGLNEGTTASGDATFWVTGDENGPSAVHHVVTTEAWVSVITLYGGQVFYEEAVVIAGEVLDIVYN